jgi:hypothetical protein
MKKLICLFVAFLIIPAVASAVDVSSINDYLSVFGQPELADGKFDGKYTVYKAGDCNIYFRELEDDIIIYVDGDGANYLALCTAAAMSLEEDNSGFSYNAGVILSNYLLACGGEDHDAYTQDGNLVMFVHRNDGITFAVNRK